MKVFIVQKVLLQIDHPLTIVKQDKCALKEVQAPKAARKDITNLCHSKKTVESARMATIVLKVQPVTLLINVLLDINVLRELSMLLNILAHQGSTSHT